MEVMTLLKVGEEYPLPKGISPNEINSFVNFCVKDEQQYVVFLFPKLNSEEVDKIKNGKIEFGYIKLNSVLVFYFKVGEYIFETPFNINYISKDVREVPSKTDENGRLCFTAHFVDSDTLKLFELKMFTISIEKTNDILTTLMEQQTLSVYKDQYNNDLSIIFRMDLADAYIKANVEPVGS